MPDTIIHDSVSSGSALLAYGESPQLKKNTALLALAVLMVVVIILTGAITLLLRVKIPLPESTAALAFIWPNQKIPQEWPSPWKQTQAANSPFPIFAGLAKDSDDQYHPFAVSIFGKISSEKHFLSYNYETFGNLPARVTDYAGTWLKIWPDNNPKKGLGGLLIGKLWRTDLPIPTHSGVIYKPAGRNYLLISAVPKLWPKIERLIAEKGINLNLDTLPEAISWNSDDQSITSLKLEFSEAINATTAAIIAGSVGIADNKLYTLPDETLITELRLPFQSIEASTSGQWLVNGKNQLTLSEKTAIIGMETEQMNETILPDYCKGAVLAVFDVQDLLPMFENFGLKKTTDIQRLILLETGGYLNICWQ